MQESRIFCLLSQKILLPGAAAGLWLNSAIMESFDIVCCFWGWFSLLLLLFVELTEFDVDISAKSAKKLFWLLEDVAVVVLPFPVPFWLVVDGPTKSLNSCPPPDVESIINYGHVMYFLRGFITHFLQIYIDVKNVQAELTIISLKGVSPSRKWFFIKIKIPS